MPHNPHFGFQRRQSSPFSRADDEIVQFISSPSRQPSGPKGRHRRSPPVAGGFDTPLMKKTDHPEFGKSQESGPEPRYSSLNRDLDARRKTMRTNDSEENIDSINNLRKNQVAQSIFTPLPRLRVHQLERLRLFLLGVSCTYGTIFRSFFSAFEIFFEFTSNFS